MGVLGRLIGLDQDREAARLFNLDETALRPLASGWADGLRQEERQSEAAERERQRRQQEEQERQSEAARLFNLDETALRPLTE